MTDDVVAPTGPNLTVKPEDIDIADFIIASNGLDKVMKNQVSLYHHGDFVTVAVTQKAADHMKVELSRIVATFHFVTMVNYKVTKDVSWDTQADARPITITNSEQANNWDMVVAIEKITVRADEVVEDGVVQTTPYESANPSGGQINLDDRNNQPEPFNATPWIIGLVVIVIAAALVYWFFLRGRTVFGHTFGAPKAKAVVAPATPAPAPAPAPAPEAK